MMLFIDGVQYTAEDVAEKLGVPLDKIKKTPEFLINPSRITTKKNGQSQELCIPAGARVPADFFVTIDKKRVHIRYAEGTNEVEKGDKYITEYYPRKIEFKGMGQVIRDENEALMVFMYIYPACINSDFANKQASAKPLWFFKDLEKEGDIELAKVMELQEALATIITYKGDPLRILAKAFDIPGTDKMTDPMVQARLAGIAQKDASDFNKKIGSNVTIFKGLIVNAIDKGVFVMTDKGDTRTWRWGMTDKKGHEIVVVPNNGAAASNVLIDHILTRTDVYYPILIDVQTTFVANKTADDYLSKQDPIDLNKMFSGSSDQNIGGGLDDIEENDSSNEDFNPEFGDGDQSSDDNQTETPVAPAQQPQGSSAAPAWLDKARKQPGKKGTGK